MGCTGADCLGGVSPPSPKRRTKREQLKTLEKKKVAIRKSLSKATSIVLLVTLILLVLPTASAFTESSSSNLTSPFLPTKSGDSSSFRAIPFNPIENSTDALCPFNLTTFSPYSTPRAKYNPNGDETPVGLDSSNHWTMIDYWVSPFYLPPPKMNGTFVASKIQLMG